MFEPIKITLDKAIDNFPHYLHMNSKADSTLQAYTTDIKQFRLFLKEEHPTVIYVENLRRNYILDYFMLLEKAKKYTRATFERKRDSLRVFCKYLNEFEYLQEDLMSGLLFRHLKSGYARNFESGFSAHLISNEQVENIIKNISESNRPNKYRDITIIKMLYQLGIRRSTLLAIAWEDIDFKLSCITFHHVKEKGVTTVYFSSDLKKTLLDFQSVSNGLSGKLFKSKKSKNGVLSFHAYNAMIRNNLIKVGAYVPRENGHRFRHSFIMENLRNGVSPYKIVQYTGHANVDGLRDYLNWNVLDTKEIAEYYDKTINYENTNSIAKDNVLDFPTKESPKVQAK